jgi:hypothetical protein
MTHTDISKTSNNQAEQPSMMCGSRNAATEEFDDDLNNGMAAVDLNNAIKSKHLGPSPLEANNLYWYYNLMLQKMILVNPDLANKILDTSRRLLEVGQIKVCLDDAQCGTKTKEPYVLKEMMLKKPYLMLSARK